MALPLHPRLHPVLHPRLARPVDHWIDQWAVASQQGARRNAILAATALTQRRAEALEVAAYLEGLPRRAG